MILDMFCLGKKGLTSLKTTKYMVDIA